MFGYHRSANETRFKWRFAGGQNMARFLCDLDPLSTHQKQVVRVGPPLTIFPDPRMAVGLKLVKHNPGSGA